MTGTEPDADIDLVLVRLAQAGDTEAFGRLVERNRHAVHRAAYAALGSATDADDVAQEAFVTAYRKLSGFRGESSFRTWLLSIAWRKALDRRRGLSKWLRLTVPHEPFPDGSDGVLDRLPSSQPSLEDRLVGDQLNRQVKRLIRTLPRKLRDVLILAVPGEFTYDEIGRMLGIPVGTVKWRVSEARRMLKDKLAAAGYTYER